MSHGKRHGFPRPYSRLPEPVPLDMHEIICGMQNGRFGLLVFYCENAEWCFRLQPNVFIFLLWSAPVQYRVYFI
jgi:hypothetical protein